jgi:hypothetical protein
LSSWTCSKPPFSESRATDADPALRPWRWQFLRGRHLRASRGCRVDVRSGSCGSLAFTADPVWPCPIAGMTLQDLCPSGPTSTLRMKSSHPPWTSTRLRRLRRRSLPPRRQTRHSARAWLCVCLTASVPKDLPADTRTLCAPPSSLLVESTPGRVPKHAPFGSTEPSALSCSVLVDSHHLDGLLHHQACGLVASHIRPWGSPRSTEAHTPCEGFPPAGTVALSPALRPPLPSIGKRPSHACTAALPRLGAHGPSAPRPDCEGLTPTGSVDRITRFPQ